MIYIDQSDKLKQAIDKLKDKSYLHDLVRSIGGQDEVSGKEILGNLAQESFQISGKDTVTLELKFDTAGMGSMRDQTILASLLAKAIDQCSTKSVSHSVQSCYSVPSKIKATYRQLRDDLGQQAAMKSCSGIEVDGKPFTWKDAKLKGFTLNVSMTKDLQGFDSKIIEKQKQQLSKQLAKNIAFHIDNVLNDMSMDRTIKVDHEATGYAMGAS